MHVFSDTSDGNKFVLPSVVRITCVEPWFTLEMLYPDFWGIVEHLAAFLTGCGLLRYRS